MLTCKNVEELQKDGDFVEWTEGGATSARLKQVVVQSVAG